MSTTKTPIRFTSYLHFHRFSPAWWNELTRYTLGINWYWSLRLHAPGWWQDLMAYWHRARYGWAPRDVWSLDRYLNQVLADTLRQLDGGHSYPATYESAEQWTADLNRWADAFEAIESWHNIEFSERMDAANGNTRAIRAVAREEARRNRNLTKALKELAPVWGNLWD